MDILKNIFISIPFLLGGNDEPVKPPPRPPMYQVQIQQTMKECLHDFMKYVLDLDLSEVQLIEKKSSNLADGGVKNSIFQIIKDEQVIAYIKATPSEKEEINHGYGEWHAYEKYISLKLPHHQPIQLLGFGEFGIDDKHYTVIAMQPANGRSLYSYLEEVGNHPKYSLDRRKALEQLNKAVTLTGQAYKELHEKHPTPFAAKEYFLRNEMLCNIYLEKTPKPDNRKAEHFDELSETFKRTSPLSGYIHGDAHPGNIFVDLEKQKVTLIDLPDMYPSIKKPDEGGPLVEDYASFLYFANLLGKRNHLTESEIHSIEDTFTSAYGKSPSFDETSLAYYESLLSMHTS